MFGVPRLQGFSTTSRDVAPTTGYPLANAQRVSYLVAVTRNSCLGVETFHLDLARSARVPPARLDSISLGVGADKQARVSLVKLRSGIIY